MHRTKTNYANTCPVCDTALRIVAASNWYDQLFWIHYSLAESSFNMYEFDDTHAHIEHAKSLGSNPYQLGRAVEQEAKFWYAQGKLEEAKHEALQAAGHLLLVFIPPPLKAFPHSDLSRSLFSPTLPLTHQDTKADFARGKSEASCCISH